MVPVAMDDSMIKNEEPRVALEHKEVEELSSKPAFSALSVGDDDDEVGKEEVKKMPAAKAKPQPQPQPQPPSKPLSLMAQLAAERKARSIAQKKVTDGEEARKSDAVTSTFALNDPQPAAPKKSKAKKAKAKKGKKQNVAAVEDGNDDDDDDMAFLDAQITKAENSHGRKVEASGNNYRRIVNGILNAPVKTNEPVKNPAQREALATKLKKEREDRTVKKKK
jgi:hypothetical protein